MTESNTGGDHDGQMKREIFRPIQQLLIGAVALIILAILISGWLTWREQQRLADAQILFARTLAFHEKHQLFEMQLMGIAAGAPSPSDEELARQIDALIELCTDQDQETPARLLAVRRFVDEAGELSGPALLEFMRLFRAVGISEAQHEAALVGALERDIQMQLRYELAAPLVILAMGALFFPITRRRVVKPLEDFGRQISGLAEGDFRPTPESEVSEHTLPLHRNFIQLAVRLQELEREHRRREASLEDEVRTATEALLEQQRSLARAERLAATGELAASVAHEVRNPLAGIQMALTNLQSELEDAELRDRVGLVLAEVERLTHLVNEIVGAARHDPEPASRVVLGELVDELLALTRYQLPTTLALESRIEQGLACRLPKERLRQALLNLVLNSAKAIGGREGRVEIELSSEGDDLVVRVSDDGPGFPGEVIESGVRPFYSTRASGTGLGLAMVRRFVREVEGKMELSNHREEGERRGATVTLLLPSVVDHG
jgi:C4-dicarboxylate-specific signal transduction histidine kinase